MQSTRPCSTRFLRISPSPEWLDDIDPLARTNPATPVGESLLAMCCTHAKFALPAGGMPYCQRLSSRRRSPPQSEMLNGGLARMKSALRSGCLSLWNVSPHAIWPSIPRIARFILARRQVVWLDSWPQTEMSALPLSLPVARLPRACCWGSSTYWTDMPEDPLQGHTRGRGAARSSRGAALS